MKEIGSILIWKSLRNRILGEEDMGG